MFKNITIKTKMLLMLIVPMLLIMAGVNIYHYIGSREVLNQQIEQTAHYMTVSYVQKLEHYLINKEAIVNSTAKSLEDENISDAAMTDFFKNLKSSSTGIINVFAGFENGKYIESNGWVPARQYDLKDREWYRKGIASNEVFYTDIYKDVGTNQMIVSIVKRINRDGRPVGVVGVDIDMNEVKKLTDEIKFGESGYGYVIDKNGSFICHPTLKPSDNLFTIDNGAFAEAAKGFLSGKTMQQYLTFQGIERYDSSMPIGKTGWVLVIDTPVSELYEGITKLGQMSIISIIASLLILGIFTFILAGKISKPIRNLSQLADRVANGDLTTDMRPLMKEVTNDEVGQLTRSFYTMTQNIIEMIEQLKESALELNHDSQKFRQASASASEIMQMIYESIEEISSRMKTVSDSMGKISLSSEEIAASMHELNSQAEGGNTLARKIGERAKVVGQEIEKAHDKSCKMYKDIEQEVNQAIEKTKTVDKISALVNSISSIAEKDDILAILADIEANREGTKGRELAVVAREIRKTAAKSARTITNIQGMTKQLSYAIMGLNNNASELVKFLGQNIDRDYDRFISISKQYNNDFKEFFLLTQEFSKMLDQVLKTISDVHLTIDSVATTIAENASSTQEITKGTEYTAKSVQEISEAANNLSEMAEKHTKIVNQFKIR